MVAVVSIIVGPDLITDAHHRNLPSDVPTSSYFYFISCLKQLYISNKTECFSYKIVAVSMGMHICYQASEKGPNWHKMHHIISSEIS